jgi:hypothetical protein
LVVTDHVTPLPPLRAEQHLKEAETLAENDTRTDADNEKLDKLLKDAREQLKMAEALGYGKKEDYEKLYAQLDEIEEKTGEGQSGKGFFDKVKKSLLDFKESLFN